MMLRFTEKLRSRLEIYTFLCEYGKRLRSDEDFRKLIKIKHFDTSEFNLPTCTWDESENMIFIWTEHCGYFYFYKEDIKEMDVQEWKWRGFPELEDEKENWEMIEHNIFIFNMESKQKAIVVSGFPGIGKSYFFDNSKLDVSDSDSSRFDKSDFPDNYIKHIAGILEEKDIIMVSSHDIVRKALVENGINFTLVYPSRELKQEYSERFAKRGSPPAFLKRLDKNWDNWIDQMDDQQGCLKMILKSGEFLSDII